MRNRAVITQLLENFHKAGSFLHLSLNETWDVLNCTHCYSWGAVDIRGSTKHGAEGIKDTRTGASGGFTLKAWAGPVKSKFRRLPGVNRWTMVWAEVCCLFFFSSFFKHDKGIHLLCWVSRPGKQGANDLKGMSTWGVPEGGLLAKGELDRRDTEHQWCHHQARSERMEAN